MLYANNIAFIKCPVCENNRPVKGRFDGLIAFGNNINSKMTRRNIETAGDCSIER